MYLKIVQKSCFIGLFLQFFLLNSIICQRQINLNSDLSFLTGTDKLTAFWLRVGQYGSVSNLRNTMNFQIGISSDYNYSSEKKINFGYGLNLVSIAGDTNNVFLQEIYSNIKWKSFELRIGRKKEIQGLVDTLLSSGSYIWSKNAVPIPKIQISIENYSPLFGNNFISIKGNFAHGWFERNSRSDVGKSYLHQKSLYLKFGKPNYKIELFGGFTHQVQWGGIAKFEFLPDSIKLGTILPQGFSNYLKIVTGKSNNKNKNTNNIVGEAGNRSGNHLGNVDIGIKLKLNKSDIFLYRQSIFEDGSLFYLNNISDGLNGISIHWKKPNGKSIYLKGINFEFLNTLSQGGLLFDTPGYPSIRGYDNYFNNGIYRDGWSYNGTTIGNPFILTKNENLLKANKEIYIDYMFNNNKIQVYYLGLSGGFFKDVDFNIKASFSDNFGVNEYSLKNNIIQKSFYLGLAKPIEIFNNTFLLYLNTSTDIGKLLNQNVSFQIGIRKSISANNFGEIAKLIKHSTHGHNQ